MKRLLSIVLAAVMVLSMIPVVFAAETVEIDLSDVTAYRNPATSTSCKLTQKGGVIALTEIEVRRYNVKTDNGPLLAIPFTVSKTADYTFEFKTNADGMTNSAIAAAPAVYIVESEITDNTTFGKITGSKTHVGYFKFSELSAADEFAAMTLGTDGSASGAVPTATLTADTQYTLVLYFDSTSAHLNSNTTDGAIDWTKYEVTDSGLTAISGSDAGKFPSTSEQSLYLSGVRLTPVEDESAPVELTGNVTLGAGADIQYKKTDDTEFKSLAKNGVDSESFFAGDSVTVKVADTTHFAGWVRGTADSGVWVSGDPEYKFNIMSPTYLTPIYSTQEANATHSVEYWDENGAYVDTVMATNGKAVFPATDKYGLVGGEFSGWWLNATKQLLEGDDVAEGITRAVARYNYGSFGTPISDTNESATYWTRDGVTVAYGKDYTFYQWDGETTITACEGEVEEKPLVVLDSTPVDGAYMIEYDKGNASEIVEAGILFGSDTDINIGSTDGSKATSQRNGDDDGDNDGHGQFCAKPNAKGSSAYARGYLIYKGTDNKLYVIYTAAVTTTAE